MLILELLRKGTTVLFYILELLLKPENKVFDLLFLRKNVFEFVAVLLEQSRVHIIVPLVDEFLFLWLVDLSDKAIQIWQVHHRYLLLYIFGLQHLKIIGVDIGGAVIIDLILALELIEILGDWDLFELQSLRRLASAQILRFNLVNSILHLKYIIIAWLFLLKPKPHRSRSGARFCSPRKKWITARQLVLVRKGTLLYLKANWLKFAHVKQSQLRSWAYKRKCLSKLSSLKAQEVAVNERKMRT